MLSFVAGIVMNIESWITSFGVQHWRALHDTYEALPSGLQEALRCTVGETSLPLGLVLHQAAIVAAPPPVDARPSRPARTGPAEETERPPPERLEEEDSRERPTRQVSYVEAAAEAPLTIRLADRSRSPVARPREHRMCPVCQTRAPHMRRHMESEHLPTWFHPEVSCFTCGRNFPTPQLRRQHCSDRHHHGAIDDPDHEGLLAWICSMRSVINFIMVQLDLEEQDEVAGRFQTEGWCPATNSGVQFNVASQFLLMDVTRAMGAPTSLLRLNCVQPAHCIEVLHWVTLMNFLAAQPRSVQEAFRNIPLVTEIPESTTLGLPAAVDSHCHLAKFVRGEGAQVRLALENAFHSAFHGTHRRLTTPRVILIIDNRVFREEWDLPATAGAHRVALPEERFGMVRVKLAYGVHPKERSPMEWQRLERLIQDPECVAIGECGLDYTVPRSQQKRQPIIFRRQVAIAKDHKKALILHLRPAGRRARPVLDEAITILDRERLPRHHRIHIHSFTGDFDDYRMWIGRYPNTIFGVSLASLRPSEEVLRLADLRHLVLESDSPYMGHTSGRRTTPYDLSEQAGRIASLRGLPVRTVIQATYANATQFYV